MPGGRSLSLASPPPAGHGRASWSAAWPSSARNGIADAPIAAGTRIGHVHLNVNDLAAAEEFYVGTLGFEITVRGYPQALFVSAGGYHHHIGLNTWAGEGAPAPPPGSRGLRWFEIVLPDEWTLEELERHITGKGVGYRREEDVLHLLDPAGSGVALCADY